MNTTPQTENIGGATNPGAYGVDATYKNAIPALEFASGVIPQDTLPAEWWNWLWYQTTAEQLHTVADLTGLFTEINNLFVQAGITPSADDLTQIKQAVLKLADQKLASYIDTLSITDGQIQFTDPQDPADKKLYVPIIGDTTALETSAKNTLVAAINEVVTKGGSLTDLETTIKTSLVNAINEVRALALSGATGNIPVGTIMPYAGETLTAELSLFYRLCDGQNYTVRQGPDADYFRQIYGVVGHLYGYDETLQEDNFNVPDLRGGVIYGANANDQDYNTGQAIAAADSNHVHQYSQGSVNYGSAMSAGTQGGATITVVTGYGHSTTNTTQPSTTHSDKGPRVKGVAINYIIKVR